MKLPGTGFKIRSRRGNEAEGIVFPKISASSRRRLRAKWNFETASRHWRAWACVAVAGLCLAGCVAGGKPLKPGQRAVVYRRAELIFTNAILFKPIEAAATNGLSWKLAPLFVQEVATTNSARRDSLTVFFRESKIRLNGRLHDQVSFVWRRSEDDSRRCIRITLNAAGLPVIWEVSADGSGAELIFVSQNLELTAIREFGSALPERRFALERSLAEAPSAMIVRVLDDAPVAMGPIVHLDASGDVSTLTCRCMPTQARQLVDTTGYRLLPLQLSASSRAMGSACDKLLRLPRNF